MLGVLTYVTQKFVLRSCLFYDTLELELSGIPGFGALFRVAATAHRLETLRMFFPAGSCRRQMATKLQYVILHVTYW